MYDIGFQEMCSLYEQRVENGHTPYFVYPVFPCQTEVHYDFILLAF